MPPYFSVVIPTYNRLNMLREVLRALGDQADAPEFEVIVVDDGSKDGTGATLEAHRPSYPFTFRSQANGGPGRARNHGVTLATGRFVVFIGDDTVPERNFLAEHARVH
ncbi:MAG: glycosyltransferase family 2 protein, partial [Thermoanaerobaculia bacterium]